MATAASVFRPSLPAINPNTPIAYTIPAPDFAPIGNVVAGTWLPTDNAEIEIIKAGPNGTTLLAAGWDPGSTISCDFILGNDGADPAVPTAELTKMCVLTEKTASGTSRSWLVIDASTKKIGEGGVVMQSLKLFTKDSLTLNTAAP